MAIAEATGRTTENPARYSARIAGRSAHKQQPIGLPPETLDLFEMAIWCEFTALWWWLDASDRANMEHWCRLFARVRTGCMDSAIHNACMRLGDKLGASYASRARIIDGRALGEEDDDDGL